MKKIFNKIIHVIHHPLFLFALCIACFCEVVYKIRPYALVYASNHDNPLANDCLAAGIGGTLMIYLSLFAVCFLSE